MSEFAAGAWRQSWEAVRWVKWVTTMIDAACPQDIISVPVTQLFAVHMRLVLWILCSFFYGVRQLSKIMYADKLTFVHIHLKLCINNFKKSKLKNYINSQTRKIIYKTFHLYFVCENMIQIVITLKDFETKGQLYGCNLFIMNTIINKKYEFLHFCLIYAQL